MPSLLEGLKDLRVLLLISVVLNAAFVAIVARDGNISVTTPWVSIMKLDLDDHVKALFAEATDLPAVRGLLERQRFYEISPDNPSIEPIRQALVDLAKSHSASALVAKLQEMARDLEGPFEGAERQAKIVIMNDDADGASEGIAQVCSKSGFEGMYITIWARDQRRGGTTVHAATEKECKPTERDFVELHAQDWNKLFDTAESPRAESVLVRVHPPWIRLPRGRQIAQTMPQ